MFRQAGMREPQRDGQSQRRDFGMAVGLVGVRLPPGKRGLRVAYRRNLPLGSNKASAIGLWGSDRCQPTSGMEMGKLEWM